MTPTYRRWRSLAVLVAAAAVGLAACGGPSSPGVAGLGSSTAGGTTASRPPPVASLGTSGGDGSTTTISGKPSASSGTTTTTTTTPPPTGNAGQSLVEWAACMRSHGDPDQADPTIDSHGGININIPSSAQSLANAVHNGIAPCNQYLAAASAALRAGVPDLRPPDLGELVKYAQCMRANGVPNYPDPGTGGSTNFNGTGVDPNSPFFQRANDICGKKIDAPSWWISGAGPPGNSSVESGPMCGNTVCTPPSGPNRPLRGATTPTTGG